MNMHTATPNEATEMTEKADGILPAERISELVDLGIISLETPAADGQIQPASMDLRLGNVAYRVRASFLPGPGTQVKTKLML